MRSKLVIWLYAAISIVIIITNAEQWKGQTFKWDQAGYQVYLPATIIFNDISNITFYNEIDALYHPSNEHLNYAIDTLANGNRINRYSVGVAVHQLPFFLVTHIINTQWLAYRPDGYSLPYEWGLRTSNLFWVIMGLLAIRHFLKRYFTDNITAGTIFIIAFGTNIFYYTALGVGGAHNYAFFHFSMILLLTDLFYSTLQKRYLFALAIIFGLVLLTRPVNILGIIIPVTWNVYSRSKLAERIKLLKQNAVAIITCIIITFIVFSPQLLLWEHVTGQWLYDGYSNEGFIWTEPKIISGLFSFQKGWLVYSPISALGLIGIYFMKFRFRQSIPTYLIFFSVFIYVTYSWWNWWYGGCFGSRPMVDITPLLALPTAVSVYQAKTKWGKPAKTILYIVLCLLITMNIFQSYQYSKGIIHYEKMSSKYYFSMFFTTRLPTNEEERLLMSSKEYYGEMTNRYNKVKKAD